MEKIFRSKNQKIDVKAYFGTSLLTGVLFGKILNRHYRRFAVGQCMGISQQLKELGMGKRRGPRVVDLGDPLDDEEPADVAECISIAFGRSPDNDLSLDKWLMRSCEDPPPANTPLNILIPLGSTRN